MAFNPAYADGTPIHEGDWVRADRGTVNGRVSEVVTSPERALARQLHGCGIVVDAQPHGLVFLSEASLAEDPLQFVRRGPSEQFRMTLSLSLGFGAILLLPALYSLASGLYSAFTDGNVLVISIGRYETSRELVPWQAGWARFAGPIVLMASLLAADGSRGVTLRWWLAGIGASCAMILLAFSRWFTSIDGSMACAGFFAFVVITALIDKWLGRVAAFLFMVVCAILLVWRVVPAI